MENNVNKLKDTVKRVNFTVNKYISDISDIILNFLLGNKEILIDSPMNSGKTTFITNELKQFSEKNNFKLILVIPTIKQIEQLKERKKIPSQYCFSSVDKMDQFVITTPDSLPKIIKHCEDLNQKFILTVDEAHETESSYNFRPAFKNINLARSNILCNNIIYFSATPDNINLSSNNMFNCILDINVKEKFINANEFDIVTTDKINLENMIIYLKKMGKQYDQVFFKIDNIELLEKIHKAIENSIILKEEEEAFYLSSKNSKDNIISELISKDKIIDKKKKYVGLTSLVNSGVEILNECENSILINFVTQTFNFINEIQLPGRFRKKIKAYNLVIEKPQEKQNLLSYDTIKEMIENMANTDLNYFNDRYKNYKNLYSIKTHRAIERKESPYLKFNEEEDQYFIDEISLNDYIYKQYIMQYLNQPIFLLQKFKNHKSFITGNDDKNYFIKEFNPEKDKEIEKELKKINKDCKKQREENKKALEKALLFLNKFDDININRMLNNLWDKYSMDEELSKHYENWLDLGGRKRKLIKDLIYLIPDMTEVKAFRIVATRSKKEVINIIDSLNAILLNEIYDKNSNDLKRRNKKKFEVKLKTIRDFMQLENYEKNNQIITEKLLEELYEYLKSCGIIKKEKEFEESKKTLTNSIKIIYKCILKQNKYLTISSVRKDINDLLKL